VKETVAVLTVLVVLTCLSPAKAQGPSQLRFRAGVGSAVISAPADNPPSSQPETAPHIVWQSGKLSVIADGAPLSVVLQEIARQTGVEVRGAGKLRGKISVSLSSMGLAEALAEILSGVDYAIAPRSNGEGGGYRVVIFGERAVGTSEATTVVSLARHNRGNARDSGSEDYSGAEAEPAADPELLDTEGASEPDSNEPPDFDKRMAALYASIRRGDQDALKEALLDADSNIQATAYEALAAMDKDAALSGLLAALKSDQAAIRLEALQLLNQSQADERSVLPALREALQDGDQGLRACAVQALASRGGAEAIHYLREAFHDPDPSFRLTVVSSLGDKDDGVPLLQDALWDPDPTVSNSAAQLLDQIDARER